MSWKKVQIGNLVTLRQGFAINKKTNHHMSEEPTQLNLLRIGDMKDGDFSIFVKDTIPEKFIAKKNDIIYTRTGQVGLVFRNQYGVVHNNCFTVTSNDESVLSQQYLYYALQEESFYEEANSRATGAAQADLTHDAFNSIEVFLPPVEIQHNIAYILDSYNSLIENNQKQIKLLEEAAQRLYKEWFIDLRFPGYENVKIVDGVPEGWKKEKLTDIADVQYGFAFDGSLFNSQGKGTPIIRIRNIPTGTTNDYTTQEADEQYIVYNGDIVVGMDGEFHINSWSGETAYLVQRTCKLAPKNELMRGWLLQAIYEPIKFFEKTIVGATVAHLGKKHIDTIELLTGPDDLYLPFKDLFNKRQLLLNQNKLFAEARDRLLPKLMSGEIEV
ncbi:restriction endonuclease subunit S [Gallibacterium genomosp. 3]|uniref:restriction endonuclease subunit S n=1 Tax=Gallibacterium genomosp. 3 TaxID=505345 RepID=UPI0008026BBC|nr:restriction endonuclease subunit S [Gallibacterium genomosp. 3]